jgi:hypothetical protein
VRCSRRRRSTALKGVPGGAVGLRVTAACQCRECVPRVHPPFQAMPCLPRTSRRTRIRRVAIPAKKGGA